MYLKATEKLFNVFAESWFGSRRGLPDAFAAFCEALVGKGGYKHLEVIEIYPNRTSDSK